MAQIHAWWPHIDKQIEELVQNCGPFQETSNKPPLAALHPWSWPEWPWQRLHIDFAGPFQGSMFMLVVDTLSKWLEILLLVPQSIHPTSTVNSFHLQ